MHGECQKLLGRRHFYSVLKKGVCLSDVETPGSQMAWTLRPFIGQPGQAIGFFRPGKLNNAYVEIFSIFRDLLF